MNDTFRELHSLTNSFARTRLLAELNDEGRLEKDRLKERIDASRTTIQRNLDALEELGWVQGDTREYRITRSGSPVADQLMALFTTIHIAKRFQPFLTWMPPDEFDLDLSALSTADLTVASSDDPYAPVNRHILLMESADQFRCLLPAIGLQPMMVAHDRVIEGACSQEIVIGSATLETLRSEPPYRTLFDRLLASDFFDCRVYEGKIPFYLGLSDSVVQIGAEDQSGAPRALVEATAEDAYAWGERTFETYHEEGESVSSSAEIAVEP